MVQPGFERTKRIARWLGNTGLSVVTGGGPGVMESLPYFLEEVYNDNKRLHSALDYRSPNEFEELPTIQKNMEVPRQTLLTLPVQSQ